MGNVIVGCEHTQVVTEAFIAMGHNAMSCDLNYDGEKGLPHYKGDLFDLDFTNVDLVIVHPPCTHIAVSGNRWWTGTKERKDAADFILRCWNIPVDMMCLENPVGQINKYNPKMPKPQYIQPHWFGHPESKKTGLWLRNLPPLVPTNKLELPECGYWNNQTPSGQNKLGPSPERAMLRSRTYEGVAQAMAQQWGTLI